MDFLETIFRSAFGSIDFSVLFLGAIFFLLCAMAAVLFVAVSETLISEEVVPWWGWATLIISTLSLPLLYLLVLA